MIRVSITLFSAAILAACSQHAAQVTSGKEYLASYKPVQSAAQPVVQRTVRRTKDGAEVIEDRVETVSTDDLIRSAASIEPLLNLPARIGIARIDGGRLTTIPNGEAAMWQDLARKHAGLGSFAAIDPFLADYTLKTVLPQDQRALRRDAGDIITKIRLGAARQHMDAVLIYEIGTRRHHGGDYPGLTPVRVLGAAPLPAVAMEKEGVARAFLMDVRNGYPYGSTSAQVSLSDLGPSFGSDRRRDALRKKALLKVAAGLVPKVETLFRDLVMKMHVRAISRKKR